MVGMKQQQSHWWWFDSHNSPRKSTWLQSTLAELDKKTKAMLKLVEEDADSFAQRAEMYYKKRPELISMVEDFYRAYRSLAERFDQVKSDSGPRLSTPLGSPFSVVKYQPEKLINIEDQSYDCCSETFDPDESGESEVEDPEREDETQFEKGTEEEEVSSEISKEVLSGVTNLEAMKLREEIERLKEENRIQKDQLLEKDEEKREVIRQLSLAMEVLKEENLSLKKRAVKNSPNKWSPLEFSKLKGAFLVQLFSGSSRPQPSVVAL